MPSKVYRKRGLVMVVTLAALAGVVMGVAIFANNQNNATLHYRCSCKCKEFAVSIVRQTNNKQDPAIGAAAKTTNFEIDTETTSFEIDIETITIKRLQ